MTTGNDDRDFAAILADFESSHQEAARNEPKPGERVSGTILSIGQDETFVDVGAKSDAVVATAELLDDDGDLTAEVGDTVEGMISGRDEGSGCLVLRVRPGAGGGPGGGADQRLALQELAQAREHGIPVQGTVIEAVKGGVRVNVSGVRAFCPISQLDLVYVEDASTYVGRNLPFLVRKLEPAGRGGHPDVVLSRRDLLAAEQRKRREEALAKLKEGAVVRGTVTSVTGYGAFVDLGGVEGLLHVSEMAHGRIEDPSTEVSEGDVLDVKVLSMEERDGQRRISLSRRALLQDPWEAAADRFQVGETVNGRVQRLEPFGAFVELAPGIQGLAHVSELSAERHVNHPRDVVELGQEVRVRILDVDTERNRISLSIARAGREDGEVMPGVAEPTGREGGGPGSAALGSMADAFKKLEE